MVSPRKYSRTGKRRSMIRVYVMEDLQGSEAILNTLTQDPWRILYLAICFEIVLLPIWIGLPVFWKSKVKVVVVKKIINGEVHLLCEHRLCRFPRWCC